MNCREFTNEFEERSSALTQKATLHLNSCPDCQKMSSQQTYIWQMIDALHQINAPNDFDFHVKARIANARPMDFQTRFLPALRYVLSAGIIVLLVGFIAFNSSYFSNNQTNELAVVVPPTAINKDSFSARLSDESQAPATITSPIADESSIPRVPPSNVKSTSTNKQVEYVAVKSAPKSLTKLPIKEVKKIEGGSHDSTYRKAPVLTPIGIPNQELKIELSNNALPGLFEQIAQFLGMETILENGNRKVKAVRQNSSAERSGIKVGDVIEELNGVKLSDESLRAKTIEAKTLTVVRGAEKIQIVLQK